ncbi:MAG: tetratricopeptide repeat protein [Verrucomicrobiota bacterium]
MFLPRLNSRLSFAFLGLASGVVAVFLGARGVTAQTEPPEVPANGNSERSKLLPLPETMGGRTGDLLSKTPKSDEKVRELLKKGKTAVSQNQIAAAKTEFVRVLEQVPDDLTALVNLGWIAQREQLWEQSESYLRRALKQSVEDPAIWLAIGLATLEQGKLESATAAFAQTVVLDPKNARARRFLGLTLGKRGWLDGAEQEIRKSLELDPDDAGAHFNLAVFYLQRRPPALELARRHYYKARDLGFASDQEIESQLAQGAGRPQN